jgi:hypothetical protein
LPTAFTSRGALSIAIEKERSNDEQQHKEEEAPRSVFVVNMTKNFEIGLWPVIEE